MEGRRVIELVPDTGPSHRELCRLVAKWLMSLPWCDVACWEMNGQDPAAARAKASAHYQQMLADVEGLEWDDPKRRQALDDHWKNEPKASVFDAVAVTDQSRYEQRLVWAKGKKKRPPKPRLHVVEVKRTRADLLSDLRAQKMLKYEALATHCSLAATAQALGIDEGKSWGLDRQAVCGALEMKGLPRHWGVVVLVNQGNRMDPFTVRPARRLPTTIVPDDRTRLIANIARSMVFRVLGDGPMEE